MSTHLYVFAYDIRKDSVRARLAELLEGELTRVQLSLFEGHLAPGTARRLARKAAAMLGPDDSLRVYAIPASGLAASMAFGTARVPEAHDYLLF